MWKKDMSFQETAALIERFLNHESLYPQEWNDFVETSQGSKKVDQFRRRCYELDPIVNSPGIPDTAALEELRSMVDRLRAEAS
jgi:hypothetical protein